MVGFIFQEYNILNDFTVGQNIGIALELQGEKASNEKLMQCLNYLICGGYGTGSQIHFPADKATVAIARALVKNRNYYGR